jgi:ATP-binding cassette subfamily B protein
VPTDGVRVHRSGEPAAHDGEAPLNATRLLVSTARRGGPWLVLLVASALVSAAAQIAFPAVMGRAVDAAVGHAPRTWIAGAAALVALLVAGDVADDLARAGATARSTSWLRRSLLARLLGAGYRPAGQWAGGDLASRLGANAADAGRAAGDAVRAGTSAAIALGSAVALALLDVWLGLTFVLGLALLTALARSFGAAASQTAESYLAAQGRIASRLVDAVAGARTIAAAGTREREVERILAPLPQLRRHGEEMWTQQARFGALDALLVPLLVVAVLAVAGLELARGRITPGAMLSAGQYALLGSSLSSAFMVVNRLARSRAGAGRAAEVLASRPVRYGTAELPPGGGCLEFRGVGACPGGRRLLQSVSFCIAPGTLAAVVGRTGAGKSLLAALAARLVDPDEGEILLDGVALPLLTHGALRRAVTYAFERPVLLGDTVAGAVAFGIDTPDQDRVEAAAAAAQAHRFIQRLPAGYATPLGEAPMSGGEAQRVGLARAFAHAGRVIVLDDVVASLDTVTEHEITQVLTGPLGGRTRLVVAQRVSTAARADVVIWLDAATVRAVAPHATLWELADYRALFGAFPSRGDARPTAVSGIAE